MADPSLTAEKDHGKPDDTHTHATDPYLRVFYKLGIDDPTTAGTDESLVDSVFVSWNTSYSKNFHKDAGNGKRATRYDVSLFKREVPANPSLTTPSDDALPISAVDAAKAALTVTANEAEVTADSETDNYSATITLNLEDPPTTGKGFYWVRVKVSVPDGENDDPASVDPILEYFAKQIVVGPTYDLTVSPSSVREDAGVTDIKVTVTNIDSDGEPEEVDKDTDVELRLGTNQTGRNDRFRISDPEITILEDNTSATGTITFTPIDDDEEGEDFADDDLLITIRTDGASAVVNADSPPSIIAGSTDIRLVDTDKASTAIDLSVSVVSLNKNAAATDIVVTATLNGNTLSKDLNFTLSIDEDYEGSARRDTDYDDTLGDITIRRGRESGTETISIRPKNYIAKEGEKFDGTGVIWLTGSTPRDRDRDIVEIEGTDTPMRIFGAPILLTKDDPSKTPTKLQAMPLSVREDAGTQEVTLEVTLQNALPTDETVYFEIEGDKSDLEGDEYNDAVDARRDPDYNVEMPSIFIPRGETKGTGTMIVKPVDNNAKDGLRVFRVVAKIRGNPIGDGGDIGILITDDDITSRNITLDVSPEEIYEGAGPTEITVTGFLDGKVFDDDVSVGLTVDGDINGDGTEDGKDEAAKRDSDYRTGTISRLVIPGGKTEGMMTFTIDPLTDSEKEDNEKIRVVSTRKPTAEDEDGDPVELDVRPATITLKNVAKEDEPDVPSQPAPQDPTRPAFAADAEIDDQVYTVGTAIDSLVLPEAAGDDTPFTYSVFSLGMPTGLLFESATRTLSGTPEAATDGPVRIIYTVVDSDGDFGVPLTFSITVNAAEDEVVPPVEDPVDDGQLTATPSSIREDAGETQVLLTVSLMAAKDTDERVAFSIVAPSEGTKGKPAARDEDYNATLEAATTIPAGATVGTTTLTLTPKDNSTVDGLRVIGVQATLASGATLMTDIEIADDETPSTSIALSADPNMINEESGETTITVTATLDGKALAEDVNVILSIDAASTASRDEDYARGVQSADSDSSQFDNRLHAAYNHAY